MLWVLVFGGIALLGLVMVVSYGIWLAHKAADVAAEVAVLGRSAARLGDLLDQIVVPSGPDHPDRAGSSVAVRLDHRPDDVG